MIKKIKVMTQDKKFQIDLEDLQALYLHTRHAYGNKGYKHWEENCKNGYVDYLEKVPTANKTFSQWVNGQIIALTSPW